VDLAHSETVEAELNRLIEKRSSREMDPDEREELWQESVRAYNAPRREANRQAWASFHERLAKRLRRRMEPLIAFHKARAATLLEGEGPHRRRRFVCTTFRQAPRLCNEQVP